MNKERLLEGAQWLRDNAIEARFAMALFRTVSDDRSSPICNSIGCAIGWLTGMLTEKEIKKVKNTSGNIQFIEVSSILFYLDWGSISCKWCFSGIWSNTDNTLEGAALRMEWLVNNGLPKDWKEQMNGKASLCYK